LNDKEIVNMGIFAKITLWKLKNDIKELKKGKIRDKIEALYELEKLTDKILNDGLNENYWVHEIKEIFDLREKYVDNFDDNKIVDIIINEFDLTFKKINLDKKIVKKNVSRISELFDKKQSKKIISDVCTSFSDNLQLIKSYEKSIKTLKNASNKIINEIAIEELKEEYYEEISSEVHYGGDTYDEEIVRAYDYGDEWLKVIKEYFDYEDGDDCVNEKINELKDRPKVLKDEIEKFNMERVKQYAPLYGYDIK